MGTDVRNQLAILDSLDPLEGGLLPRFTGFYFFAIYFIPGPQIPVSLAFLQSTCGFLATYLLDDSLFSNAMASTIVLISGANRGLGKALLELYLARSNHTVIAAIRDPNHTTSRSLANLLKADSTSLLVVKIDASVEADAAHGIKQLSCQGIDYIDIVVANAGIHLI